MKRTLIVASLAAVAAGYAGEFPYYPEYADEFAKVEEVTPAMAKKAVIGSPFYGQGENWIVCEPLLLKDNEGMPYCYMVATYAGSDLAEVRKWNNIIKKINGGGEIPAGELAAELELFYTNEFQTKLATYVVSPYTYNPPILASTEEQFDGLAGYVPAYKLAAAEFGGKPIFLSRIIGIGYWMAQIFVFSGSNGETIAVETDEYYQAEVVNVNKYGAARRDYVKRTYEGIRDHADLTEKNEKRWRLKLERIPDEEVNEEFPRQVSLSQNKLE
jgi:hypothetical protein